MTGEIPSSAHLNSSPVRLFFHHLFLLQLLKSKLGGVHHYDEYGLRNLLEEPPEIRKIHGEMITFVTEWLKGWEDYKKNITNTKVEGS